MTDGQRIFLHPTSVKMLQLDAEIKGRPLPQSLEASIAEIELLQQSDSTRKRFPACAELPLGASFAICELDLAGVVDPQVLDTFGPWLAQRAAKRSQRAKLAARKDRRATRAAATFEQTQAYPQPQAPPPAIDAEGFVQLCEGPSPGTSPVQRPAGPPGGVSYARLTKEGLAATGPTLSGAPVGSEPPPTVELRGVWAASTKSGGAGSKTGAASGASISDMQSLSVTKKGKKTVLNLGQRRY